MTFNLTLEPSASGFQVQDESHVPYIMPCFSLPFKFCYFYLQFNFSKRKSIRTAANFSDINMVPMDLNSHAVSKLSKCVLPVDSSAH